MKRPITEHEISVKRGKAKDTKKFDREAKKAYRVFRDQQELEKHFKNEGGVWNTYTAKDFGVEQIDFSADQKKSFEFYVCGWLQYYDQITRNNCMDHVLDFKWSNKEVVVYISPPPGNSLNPITSPPADSTDTSDPQSPTVPPPPNP